MDDRNLTAVAEQAAATSRVKRNSIEGCTILYDDGHVAMGCRLEYDDASLDQNSVSNALAAGRVNGSYRPFANRYVFACRRMASARGNRVGASRRVRNYRSHFHFVIGGRRTQSYYS